MQPLIWLGILALLLVVEAITAGLTTIWFALVCMVSLLKYFIASGLVKMRSTNETHRNSNICTVRFAPA